MLTLILVPIAIVAFLLLLPYLLHASMYAAGLAACLAVCLAALSVLGEVLGAYGVGLAPLAPYVGAAAVAILVGWGFCATWRMAARMWLEVFGSGRR